MREFGSGMGVAETRSVGGPDVVRGMRRLGGLRKEKCSPAGGRRFLWGKLAQKDQRNAIAGAESAVYGCPLCRTLLSLTQWNIEGLVSQDTSYLRALTLEHFANELIVG